MRAPPQPTIESIQILRFIAALVVVVDHVAFVAGQIAQRDGQNFQLPHFPGRLGVDIFFVISGFIMVYISSANGEWKIKPKRFIWNRFVRIAPIYYLATVGYIALFFLSGNPSRWTVRQYASSFFFIPDFDAPTGLPQPILSQGWTLNFEMFFYLLFATALSFPRKVGAMFLFAVFVSLVVAGQILNFLLEQNFVLTPSTDAPALLLPRFWLHPIILEFCAGIALALLRERCVYRNQLISFPHPIFVSTCALAAYIWLANVDDMSGTLGGFIRFGIAVSCIALCVFTRQENDQSRTKWLLVLLGNASYSLYLFHPHIMFVLNSAWKRLPLDTTIFVVVAISSSIVASVLSYLLFEKPITRLFK